MLSGQARAQHAAFVCLGAQLQVVLPKHGSQGTAGLHVNDTEAKQASLGLTPHFWAALAAHMRMRTAPKPVCGAEAESGKGCTWGPGLGSSCDATDVYHDTDHFL